jgi:hypothetical protein
MRKQSLQLSTLTLAGSLTTLLRTQFSSALEPRNLFLLVADIYRRISLLPTKIQTYITNDNRPLKIDKKTLSGQDSTTANTDLAKVAVQCSADAFVVNQTLVLRINPDSYRDGENRHLRQAWERYSTDILI